MAYGGVQFTTALTGGASVDGLDQYDGANLQNGDCGFVKYGGNLYIYNLDSGSGAAENSPYVISPDSNAGNKRWILQGVHAFITEEKYLPIHDAIDGGTAPDAIATTSSGTGKVNQRTFDGTAQVEDVLFNWEVPRDIYAPDGIKYRVCCVLTAATGPSNEGVVFQLSGRSIGHGDTIGAALGTAVKSSKTAMTEVQYDRVLTDLSATVTITDLAASEMAMLKLERLYNDADDTYGQLIGVTGIRLQYTRLIKNG